MRTKLVALTVLSAGLGLLAGCIVPSPTPIVFTQTANGTTQVVPFGSYVNISLASISPGSTGYQWQLVTISNPTVVQSLGDPTFTPSTTGLIGSSGTTTFAFKVIGRGTSTITLQLFPPGVLIPVDTYTLTLVAQ